MERRIALQVWNFLLPIILEIRENTAHVRQVFIFTVLNDKKKPIKHCKQQIFEEIETEKCKCIDVRVSTHKYAALNGYSVVRQFWLATKWQQVYHHCR